MYWISSKRSDPCIKTFSTLSGIRIVFWVLPHLDILCTSAVKRYYAKTTTHRSSVTCFPCNGVHGSKKNLLHSRSDLSLVDFLLWRALQQNCIVKTSEMLIIWSTSCYTAGSDKSNAMERVPDRLLKRAAKVFRVHNIDMLNCCWPIDVHSQQWFSILRELCTVIERHT